MKLLCLTKYTVSGPSSRYRVFQFLPYLERAGVEVEIQPLHDDTYLRRMFAGRRPSALYLMKRGLRRALKLLTASHFDVVLVQKEIFPSLPAIADRLLVAGRTKVVVDLDDAIFALQDGHSSRLKSRWLGAKVPDLLRRSSLVLAGNSFLKSYAERFARRVVLFPTVVDADKFRPRQKRSEPSIPVCGWIGSPATVGYIDQVIPVLEHLSKSERFVLRLIGAEAPPIEGLHVDARPWREEDEVEDLASIDVGLMPLTGSEWSEGKCALKLLQYMSMGIPSVSSPRGAATEIITDGVNGFLADTPQEWRERLQQLICDSQLRRTMGDKARSWIEENYNLRKYGPILVSQLTSLVGRS